MSKGERDRLRFESLAGHVRIVHWLLEDRIGIDSCDSSCYDYYFFSPLLLTAYETWALLESVNALYLVVAQAGGSVVKKPSAKYRRCGVDLWVGNIPWRRKWQPTPVSLPEKSHGQRSLVSYSPWGHKEWSMSQQ